MKKIYYLCSTCLLTFATLAHADISPQNIFSDIKNTSIAVKSASDSSNIKLASAAMITETRRSVAFGGAIFKKEDTCDVSKGFIKNKVNNQCVCDTSKGFLQTPVDDACKCDTSKGLLQTPVDGACQCDTSKGFLQTPANGACQCDTSRGYELYEGKCIIPTNCSNYRFSTDDIPGCTKTESCTNKGVTTYACIECDEESWKLNDRYGCDPKNCKGEFQYTKDTLPTECINKKECTQHVLSADELSYTDIIKYSCETCQSPFVYNNGKCECPTDRKLEDGKCVCKDDYIEIDGVCYHKCSDPKKELDPVTKECVCKDIYDSVDGECLDKCAPTTKRDPVTKECVCVDGLEKVNGLCVPKCADDRTRDENGNCICKDGLTDIDGKCLPDCGENEERNSNNECACIDGYKKVNGVCSRECQDFDIYYSDDTCSPDKIEGKTPIGIVVKASEHWMIALETAKVPYEDFDNRTHSLSQDRGFILSDAGRNSTDAWFLDDVRKKVRDEYLKDIKVSGVTVVYDPGWSDSQHVYDQAINEVDGRGDTLKYIEHMKKTHFRHQMVQYCYEMGTGNKEWFVPAFGQLAVVMENWDKVNEALEKAGVEELPAGNMTQRNWMGPRTYATTTRVVERCIMSCPDCEEHPCAGVDKEAFELHEFPWSPKSDTYEQSSHIYEKDRQLLESKGMDPGPAGKSTSIMLKPYETRLNLWHLAPTEYTTDELIHKGADRFLATKRYSHAWPERSAAADYVLCFSNYEEKRTRPVIKEKDCTSFPFYKENGKLMAVDRTLQVRMEQGDIPEYYDAECTNSYGTWYGVTNNGGSPFGTSESCPKGYSYSASAGSYIDENGKQGTVGYCQRKDCSYYADYPTTPNIEGCYSASWGESPTEEVCSNGDITYYGCQACSQFGKNQYDNMNYLNGRCLTCDYYRQKNYPTSYNECKNKRAEYRCTLDGVDYYQCTCDNNAGEVESDDGRCEPCSKYADLGYPSQFDKIDTEGCSEKKTICNFKKEGDQYYTEIFKCTRCYPGYTLEKDGRCRKK